MNRSSSLRVATRMQILVGLALVGLIVLCIATLYQFKDSMIEDRKAKIRNLVEYATTQFAFYDEQAKSGKMTLEHAQALAKEVGGDAEAVRQALDSLCARGPVVKRRGRYLLAKPDGEKK